MMRQLSLLGINPADTNPASACVASFSVRYPKYIPWTHAVAVPILQTPKSDHSAAEVHDAAQAIRIRVAVTVHVAVTGSVGGGGGCDKHAVRSTQPKGFEYFAQRI